MKLITKTQRIYLTLVIALLLVWSGIFMYAISSALEKNIDETLHSELLALVNKSKRVHSIHAISMQQLQVKSIAAVRDTTINFSDTTLFNSIESESFSYRQVETQATIGGKPYQLILRRSMVEYDDLFEVIVLMELIFIVLLIGVLFIINKNMLRRLWRPFYDTLHQITEYDLKSGKQIEWSKTDIDEFRQLNQVLTELLDQIKRDYQSLKQFTENASHEIQTPLSIIKSRIELLLQSEDLTKEHHRVIQQIYEEAGRLSRLNRALMLLAKIENHQFKTTERFNISRLLENTLEQFEDFASHSRMHIKQQVQPDVMLSANQALISIMIRNLISNAIVHGAEGSDICVWLSSEKLEVANPGRAPAVKAEKLFNRFQKSSSSASPGLGLSIVKAICELYHYQLQYRYIGNKHVLTISYDNAS